MFGYAEFITNLPSTLASRSSREHFLKILLCGAIRFERFCCLQRNWCNFQQIEPAFQVFQLFKTRIVKKRATFVRKVTIGEVSAKSAGNDSRFGAVPSMC
jgi:hypothetical protein